MSSITKMRNKIPTKIPTKMSGNPRTHGAPGRGAAPALAEAAQAAQAPVVVVLPGELAGTANAFAKSRLLSPSENR
jgi:hypothetical protein